MHAPATMRPRDRIRYSRCHWRGRLGDRHPVAASTVPDLGRCRPPGRTRRGKGSMMRTLAATRLLGPQFRVPGVRWQLQTGGTIAASAPDPGSPAVPCIHVRAGRWLSGYALRCHGRIRCSRGHWRHASSGAGGTVAAGACRVREHRCRRRRHAGASGENGRVDADTRFQPLLLPRKSPNLSNNQRIWSAHSRHSTQKHLGRMHPT
jgi:hypothetical protein